ncbi:hypothetical protein M436DRAFT_78373 [Aureobasidium namibiae CBS 147.97]|uniref:Uncharacterized protein n=1 Tax=Aureobasidium namibiae CBS 147.97 TaxID=1043004 RepID=A0A074WTX0_9PEZI
MRRRNQIRESGPEEGITSDNYLIQLLREEEVVEAIRMVDPEKASEPNRKLEQNLQEPWTYLNKSNKIPNEERLKAFQALKKESEEAEDIKEPTALTEDNPLHSTAALVEYSPPRKYHPQRISIKNKSLVRPPSHNGEYTWSRLIHHINQEFKRAAKEALIARDTPLSNAIRHAILETLGTQSHNHNMRNNTESPWKIPEELKYRPFDAVRAFEDDRRERPLRIAAKKIAIVVTQH